MHLDTIADLAGRSGLSVRGAFHPDADFDALPPGGRPVQTIVLLGWTGRSGWTTFAASPEAADGRPHPIDRWSKRTIDALAAACGARPFYPFDGPPWLPFQRWAMRAEPVHASPLGILIHPDWGLWHSYRGALGFAERLDLPAPDERESPCDSCVGKPCLTGCPVGAFQPGRYDVSACAAHVRSPAGTECRERGCLARRACPVAPNLLYGGNQAAHLMRAFVEAH